MLADVACHHWWKHNSAATLKGKKGKKESRLQADEP
jgi:hypothetical protein